MRKTRVLLVDDEAIFTELLKINLEAAGDYEVQVENRGAEALAAARAFQPDIIFLDVIMPDLDGSRVAAQLQMDPVLRRIPIVYVTAILSKQDTEPRGRIVGAVGCLAKPVDTQEIITCIGRYLGTNGHSRIMKGEERP